MQLQDKVNMLKDNPRLLFGMWLIVLILWSYGLLDMNERLQHEVQVYNGILSKIKHVHTNAAQKDWVKRRDEARDMLSEIEVGLWREPTPGLAQAALNDWLVQTAQQAGVQSIQLAVALQESPVRGGASGHNESGTGLGVWKVSTKLISEFNPKAYYRLLEKISTNDKRLKIESLTIHTMPTPKAELMLVAYFSPTTSLEKSDEKAKADLR